MSKHVGHQNISIVAIAGTERETNVIYNVQVALKKFQSSIKSVYFELFFLLSRGLSEQSLINQLEMSSLHNVGDLR